VDGVFLRAPSTLCGSPVDCHGVGQVYPCCHGNASGPCVGWSVLSRHPVDFRVNWLTSQTRFVRVQLYRRAIHASGDSSVIPKPSTTSWKLVSSSWRLSGACCSQRGVVHTA
jgi:hypothetical protein